MNREIETEKYREYYRIQMQKGKIMEKLREKGCRITKQRNIILDIILSEHCSSCKEIYYLAAGIDSSIGTATVYRMVNLLEEIGALRTRKNYEIACVPENRLLSVCAKLDDDSEICLNGESLNTVLCEGMKACGYLEKQTVISLSFHEQEE